MYNKDELLKAIQLRRAFVVKNLLESVEPETLPREVLVEAIDSRTMDILTLVADKTKQEVFDRDIMQKALNTYNNNIVNEIELRIIDKESIKDLKGQIEACTFKQNDIMNVGEQILTLEGNSSNNFKKQVLLFDLYKDVFTSFYNDGKIPSKFPIKDVLSSIEDSKNYISSYKHKNGILDTLHNENKFLVLPIWARGHVFSAVIRKNISSKGSDKISIILVNLGSRPFETGGSKDNKYKEYIFDQKTAESILEKHTKFTCKLSVSDVYSSFKSSSLENYDINLTSKEQVIGNCYIKNLEKGLRLASCLITSKLENKNFDSTSLRIDTDKSEIEKIKVKFLKNLTNEGGQLNGFLTRELNRNLISALAEKAPQYRGFINSYWQKYSKSHENRGKNVESLNL